MSKNRKAVGYIRMSSGKQEKSPAQQRNEVEKLAKREGYQIIRWYSDEAISGDATDKRVGFQQMIADAQERGDFTVVLCWDQDRFGRFDSVEAGKWIHPLREAGVCLVTCAQGMIDWNDFTGRMMYSIVQEGKHQYLIDLSRNVLRGRIASAKRGGMIVSPPYGYDRIFFDATGKQVRRVPYGEKFSRPQDWTVRLDPAANTEEVETVRWMFDTYVNTDSSLRSLVLDLNARKVPTRRGKGWSAVSVRYILTHPVYIGHLVFGRHKGGKYHQVGDDGEMVKSNGKGYKMAPIVVEDAHEPLIDRETFDRVQVKVSQRAVRKGRPRKDSYLLTGLVKCGHCGRSMCGKPSKDKKNPKRGYYYCPGGHSGRCKCYHVRSDWLDSYVLKVVEQVLCGPRAVETIKKAIRQQAKGKPTPKNQAATLKRQAAALDAKIAKGNENLLLADPAHVADLSALLTKWREEHEQLTTELGQLAGSPQGRSPAAREKHAVAAMQNIGDRLRKATPVKRRAIVRSVAAGIELWWIASGKRYRKLHKGKLSIHLPDEVLEGSPNRTLQILIEFTESDIRPMTQFEQAAALVAKLYDGTPVRSSLIAKRMGVSPDTGNGARILKRAEEAGLVRRVSRNSWEPTQGAMT